ncbi:MAG TPA: hypothetical protein VLC46_11620 [Thermoanaerobaculia bacterium]|nr:hypothetical protein [Thermoanaerobaculia bacterium]
MRRLPSAVILVFLFLSAGIAQAQTCPPPVIMLVGGANPACAGQPVTLDAGPGWATYQWSPGGATTEMISDSPNATMSYTVTTTDANGCSVTSQPLTVVVNAAPAAPSINLRETTLCGGAQGEATVAGTWSSYSWSVTNGTIAGGPSSPAANGPMVDYTADGSGPITVSVTVTDSNGCTVTASADVTIAKPIAQTYPSAICPGSRGEAMVGPPAEGGSWATYHWTITNGTILPNSGGDSYAYVYFTSDPGGQPVTVQVTTTDTYGCSATSDPVTIPVRSIAKPIAQTYPSAICPGSRGEAMVGPPAEGGNWATYHWTITNGTILPNSGGDSWAYVYFTSDPGGQPVTVQVTATDTYGCTATSDPVTIPVRSIARPVAQTYPSAICPGSRGEAMVGPPVEGGNWATYHWTITNGTILPNSGGDSYAYVYFTSDPGGQPVTVQVTATDTYGCTATSDPVTIPVRSIAKPVVQTYPSAICPNSMGEATIGPPAEGGDWATYHWTITNGTILPNSGGDSYAYVYFTSDPGGQPVTVQVTATDTYGCSATSDPVAIPIRVLDPPPITVASPSVCTGAYIDAHIDSPAYPNSPWQSVTWSATNAVTPGGGMIPNDTKFFATATGGPVTLTVTVSDTNGCAATSTIQIPVAANPPTAVMTIPDNVCAGSVFTVTAHDPDNVVQYFQFYGTNATLGSIDAGGTATFTANGPGPIDIYATSGSPIAACAVYGHASTVAVNPPAATISASGPTAICPGGNVTLTAPNGMLSYNWSTGATTQAITVTNAGSYTVTVSNAPGCSSTSAPLVVTVDVPVTPTITASHSTTICAGGSVTLTASAGASYVWSTGATTQAITVTASGNYNVTVTDATGCSAASASTVVTVSTPAAAITTSGPTTFCAGGSVTLTANSGASYLWSNGATTQAIAVSTAGNYSVTVTDANGCSALSAPTSVTVNASLYAYILNAPQGRIGFGNGSDRWCEGTVVTLTAKPDGMTYLWSTGETTQAITVNSQATYSVTVTNANGCSAVNSANVWYDPAPKPVINPPASTSFCGVVQLTVDAVANAQYSWVRQGQGTIGSGSSLTVLNTGTYYVVAEYSDSCSSQSDPITLTRLPDPQGSITASTPKLCPGGSVALTASDNDPSATFLWATGETTSTLTVSAIGYYTVHITQTNGCAFDLGYNLTADTTPLPPIGALPSDATACDGGSVNLYSNGSGPWLWSNGATTGSITVTTAGDYFVTKTDDNGCTQSSNTIHVTIKPLPAKPTITAGGPTTFCYAVGSVTLTSSPGAVYRWSNGQTTQSIGAQYTGDYTVQVLGANGCWSPPSDPIHVIVNMPPQAWITASGPTTFCPGQSVTLTANGGTTVRWITGETTRSITVTATGNYSVTTTDDNGCSSTSVPTSVTVNPSPSAAITPSGPTTFCDGGSVTLTAAAASSYSWSNGATTSSITVNTSGAYSVTVTGANGCSATSAPTIVTVNPLPVATITASGPTTFCAGGSVTLTASSGASYHWSTGATTQSIAATANGNYSVTVTGANGCSTTSSPTTVTLNANPTANITPSGSTTLCAGGSVTLNASSGASYLWSTGATTQAITASAPGNFSVTVTNAAGCLATSAPVTVAASTLSANVSASATTICAGQSAILTANATGGNGPYTYQWSNGAGPIAGATSRSYTATVFQGYYVTVTDAGGCSVSTVNTPVIVNVNPSPSSYIVSPPTFCSGGTYTVGTPDNSFTSYTFSVTNGTLQSSNRNTAVIVAGTSGSVTVQLTVTNSYGCSWTGSQIVPVTANPPTPVITASGPTTFCHGNVITLTAPAGYSYQWRFGSSNVDTAQSIVIGESGSYTVTVTDANGCSATSTPTMITANALPVATITAGGATTICAGGSVTLTASSGASYLWSTGATTQAIAASNTGNYSVTVTDANGCSATSSPTTVTVNAIPTATITAGGPTTFCAGGSVTLTASSGQSYLWSTGATTQAITVNSGGNYRVTVTGANGCSATSSPTTVTVNANPTATITAGGPTTFCAGGSVTLTASSGASYLWSTGDTSPSIAVFNSGSYSVTVTNTSGCSVTSSPTTVTVNANPTATITAGGPTTFCVGGSVTLTASPAASYRWSNGQTTSSITMSSSASFSGSYTVTVTNASGCSATSSPMTVAAISGPTAGISTYGPTTFCAGSSVTFVLTLPGGTSVLWSTGATTPSITVSSSGSYSAIITDANGCSATITTDPVTVEANPTPSITAGGPTTFCAGGSVMLTASSGASYLWSTGATTQAITANASGNYRVTVTNANGCGATSSPTAVTVNALPTPTITAGGSTTFCAGGSVTLTATSGASYLWSTGATTQSIAASASGNYTVNVTNANGCSATSSPTTVTVNANPATPTITAGGPTTFCAGGSVTLTSSPAASYRWSDGETTASITVSSVAIYSGSYTVTVTNASGCSATSSPMTVNAISNPTPSISSYGPTTFCAGGSVMLSASGGTSVLWSTGATTSSITVSSSGSYSAIITDANGCSSTTATVPVTITANPTATITASGPTTFCAGGSVTLTASSGTSYLWSTGATTQAVAAGSTGSYSVTVTNASGCSTTSSPATVTVNAVTTPVISAGGPTTFCAGGSVTLTVSSGASYLWSSGATTQAITAATAGNFSVTVTDANGCSATSSPKTVTVNANATPTVTAGGPTTFCAGGSVTLTASSGASYLWSTGATTSSITVSSGGSYSVTVGYANGCSATSAATVVTVNANPTATITAGGPTAICPGGGVTLTASSGASYLWSNGATTQAISATTAGSYSVTVTSASGCHGTSAPTVVTVKTLPTATVSGGGAICPGASSTITATLTGTAPWSVTWSDNVTQPIASGTTATRSVSPSVTTHYTVTSITDASSCATAGSGSATVTVNAPASITTQPLNTSTTQHTNVTLTVVAAGTSPISYQWFKGNGTSIGGATSSSYTTSFGGKGTNTFYVEVWNACNAAHVKSTTVTVTVN